MAATVTGDRVASLGGDRTQGGHRTYQRVIRVATNNRMDGPLTVRTAAGVPQIGTAFSFGTDADPTAFVRRILVRQVSKYIWEVTCDYSSQDYDPVQDVANPLMRPPRRQWGSVGFSQGLYEDLDGNAVVNSRGEPYDPPVERERSIQVYTVVRNEPFFDAMSAYQYADAVNSDQFLHAPPGYAKFSHPQAEDHYENGVAYWQVRYEILLHPLGWDERRLDEGVDTKADSDGTKYTVMVPLDGAGDKLSEGEITAGNYVYNTFRRYRRMPFAVWGL